MKSFAFFFAAFLFTFNALADGPVIIETDKGFIVEYTGKPDPDRNAKRIAELKSQIFSLTYYVDHYKKLVKDEKDDEKKYNYFITGITKHKELIAANKELAELTIKDKQQLSLYLKDQLRMANELDKIENELNFVNFYYDSSGSSTSKVINDDISVGSITATQYDWSTNYSYYTIKAAIYNNNKSGLIYVRISGKDRNDKEVDSVLLSGNFTQKESKSLSSNIMLTPQQVLDIRKWEVSSIDKY